MATLLIAVGVALTLGGLVVFPVLSSTLLEPIPPRSSLRLLFGLLTVAVNLSATAGGIGLLYLGSAL